MFDALASLWRKPLRQFRMFVLIALARSGAQKLQLAPIPTAPFAEEQMKSEPCPLENRKLSVERLRLKPAGVFTARGNYGDASNEAAG